jgi:hypothetical protein
MTLDNKLTKAAVIGSTLTALVAPAANAALISVTGDKGSTLEWNKIDDRTLTYSIDSSNAEENYSFDQVLTPFVSSADRSLISVDAGIDWECLINRNYSVCTTFSEIGADNITRSVFTNNFFATFSLPEGYQWGDFLRITDLTATTNGNSFELFESNSAPVNLTPTNPEPPVVDVSAPLTPLLFGLGLGALVYSRRQKSLVDNKYNF